ncbi:Mediator of RNA polymerase II transcription subunit 33B [Trichinella spiralis]|uniref:Mediator of RNA polymerase II transcription subunit 33B n=1 Tax=Trichinella spiralis TaxID=6334 RepID=A0ABR3L3Z4_TRISP
MEREQHHITDLEKVSFLAWLASPDALARCLRNDKPHDNDRSQAFCRAVVKVMPEAHSNPPPSLVIPPIYNDKLSPETATLAELGWTCSKILAVPSQPDRGNGNAMRDDDMIVIEALLFQLHPADLLKKHAWLNPYLLVIPRTACMHVVDTRSQIINSQNRLLPICQAFESAARNGVPAPVDPLPCQQIVAKNSQTCALLSFPREARRPQRPLGTQFGNEMS